MSEQTLSQTVIEREIEDNLRYLEGLSRSSVLHHATRSDIAREAQALADRMADRELRLAVVGEFSSGKSAFINALLGAEVLPEGFEPVTARTTRIAYSGSPYGEAVIAGKTERFNLADLARYSREGQVQQTVTGVRIFYPSPLLKEGLIILDTPGGNAGNALHDEERERAVAAANAAVWLTPAHNPATGSSLKLLKGMQNHIDKLFFLLTKVDDQFVEIPDDVPELIEHVAGYVKQTLGQPDPVIYPISAKRVLKGKPLVLEDGGDTWQVLLDDLTHFMRQERAWVILGDLLNVQGRVLTSVHARVENHHQLCEAEVEELLGRSLDVERQRHLLSEQVRGYVQGVREDLLARYRNRIAREVTSLETQLQAVIADASSIKSMRKDLERAARERMDESVRAINGDLRVELQQAAQRGRGLVTAAFASAFAGLVEASRKLFWRSPRLYLMATLTAAVGALTGAYDAWVLRPDLMAVPAGVGALLGAVVGIILVRIYQELAFRQGSFAVGSDGLSTLESNVVFSISGFTSEQVAGVTGTAGAVIGAALGGPIGAVLGMLAGGALGSLFGMGLDEAKREFRAKVADLVFAFDENLRSQYATFVVRATGSLEPHLAGLTEIQFARYQDGLMLLLKRQRSALRRVEEKKAVLRRLGDDLRQRLDAGSLMHGRVASLLRQGRAPREPRRVE